MSAKDRTRKKVNTKPPPIEDLKSLSKKELITQILGKKTRDKFLNENQKKFHDILKDNQITICSGPAGTGKSYLALRTAIELISDPTTPYEKIIIIRPAVEGGEQAMGYLKGTLREKMDPYMYPSFYLLNKIIGKEATSKLEHHDIIEVMSLSFLRGINVENALLIGEEFQNATPSEMKLTLTRIGFNSKFFITGDIDQSDKYRNKKDSGLYDAMQRLKDIPNIGMFEFEMTDIVRNPIISEILKKYEIS